MIFNVFKGCIHAYYLIIYLINFPTHDHCSSSSSSSSSPLLSLVTSTSEISHPPVHTYTTYI